MVRSCFVAPETGRKRHLQRIKKAKQGRRETRTRVKPSTRVFCPTPIAPKTQNPRPHPRRPGTGPTSAPTSARDPLLYAISEVLERTLAGLLSAGPQCSSAQSALCCPGGGGGEPRTQDAAITCETNGLGEATDVASRSCAGVCLPEMSPEWARGLLCA
jgi:hypothetical protein